MALGDVLFLAAGLGLLLAAAVPRALANAPFSLPLVFLAAGFLLLVLPLGLPDIDPVGHRTVTEHATESVVIISLMGAGLALNRPPSRRGWSSAWRLLAVGMPVTIALVALGAVLALGWPLAAAVLLGAVLAPTDPVLASDVQVAEPVDAEEETVDDEVRFALTAEAGLNDGLAFPFVYAAVALTSTAGGAWLVGWALEDLLYRTVAGVVGGLLVGRLLGRLFFRAPVRSLRLAEHADGFVALGVTFLAYGLTELAHGYGFVAVFVAACSIRAAERRHGYHGILHGFVEQVERLLTAWLLLLLGGALATGILAALTWPAALLGLAVVVLIRPIAGWAAQLGGRAGRRERAAIAFFGIRGMGSIYYLAYVTGHADFGVATSELWAVVTFVVLVSVLAHGVTATPAMARLDRLRRHAAAGHGAGEPGQDDLAAQHP